MAEEQKPKDDPRSQAVSKTVVVFTAITSLVVALLDHFASLNDTQTISLCGLIGFGSLMYSWIKVTTVKVSGQAVVAEAARDTPPAPVAAVPAAIVVQPAPIETSKM